MWMRGTSPPASAGGSPRTTFIDCTGDGWIGYWAGAEYPDGPRGASEFGESRAPGDAQTR